MPQLAFAGELSTGGIIEVHRLDLGHVIQPDTSPVAGQRCPILAYAIRHPRGIILFDTGLGDPHPVIDRLYTPVRNPLPEALQSAGIDPSDIDTIVNCHLHFDHCGGNPLFPNTPIYAQATEYRISRDSTYTLRDRVDFPNADLRQLTGETEIEPVVKIVPTPGHTAGHQSLVIDTADGPVILAGQAAYTSDEFADPDAGHPAGIETASDPQAARESIRMLHHINPTLVLFAHDDSPWAP